MEDSSIQRGLPKAPASSSFPVRLSVGVRGDPQASIFHVSVSAADAADAREFAVQGASAAVMHGSRCMSARNRRGGLVVSIFSGCRSAGFSPGLRGHWREHARKLLTAVDCGAAAALVAIRCGAKIRGARRIRHLSEADRLPVREPATGPERLRRRSRGLAQSCEQPPGQGRSAPGDPLCTRPCPDAAGARPAMVHEWIGVAALAVAALALVGVLAAAVREYLALRGGATRLRANLGQVRAWEWLRGRTRHKRIPHLPSNAE